MTAVAGDDEITLLAREIAACSDSEIEQLLALCSPADAAVIEFAVSQIVTSGEARSIRAEPALLAAYLTRNDPRPFSLWRYVRLLSQQFVKLTDGTSPRQLWSMPPRYGKSLSARYGLAWLLERRPQAKCIYTSYAADLAEASSVFVRDLIVANPDVFTVRLATGRRARREFITTAGGGIRAAGFDGQITGFGAGNGGGIVIDDPFKGWPEAHSEHERDHVWHQWQSVLLPRLDDEDAWVLVVQTRWHEDDLTGRLMDADGAEWEIVRIPAIAEAHDPESRDPLLRLPDLLDRAPGEVIEPERFTLKYEQQRAEEMGSYLAAGLLQQRPAPAEGGEIKRGWWRWTSNLPTKHDEWITSWDMKLKEKQTGDWQVGQVWGRTGSAFFGHAQLRGQWTVLKCACAIALLAARFPLARKHFVENTGNGPEVMDRLRGMGDQFKLPKDIADELAMTPDERKLVTASMRRGLLGVIPVTPKGDKRARARAVAALLEAGGVWLPERADWAYALVDECAAFPDGAHDDMVDAWSQGLAALSGRIRHRAVAAQGDERPSQWRIG